MTGSAASPAAISLEGCGRRHCAGGSREAIAWLGQTYGNDSNATDQPSPSELPEVILLVTPGCRRNIAADRRGFLRRAQALLREQPDASFLSLPTPDAVPSLQPLGTLLLEVEAALHREPDSATPGTPAQPARR